MNTDMFNKTKKRIYRTLMIAAALLIIFMIVPSIIVFSAMFRNMFLSLAEDRLDRSISASRIYIDSIMSTTRTLTLDEELTSTLSGSRTGTLKDVLDAACNYSLYINGISVYGADGSIYTSSGVSDPPTEMQLRNHADIAEFFDDADAAEYVSIRNSDMAAAYDGVTSSPAAGIISCCCKVYDADGGVLGYIFADVFPENIYEYFEFEGDRRLEGSTALIIFNGGVLSSAEQENAADYIAAAPETVTHGKLIVSNMRNFYGGSIRLAVPVDTLYGDIATISGVAVVCGAALMVITHFIAARVANGMKARLNGLMNKMTASASRFG